MSTAESIWQLRGITAECLASGTATSVDLQTPTLRLALASSTEQITSLKLSLPQPSRSWSESKPIVDSYTRGNDLVTAYAESVLHPLRVQIYWRVVPDVQDLGIEVLIATQTYLLDSNPALEVSSTVPRTAELYFLDRTGSVRPAGSVAELNKVVPGMLLARLAEGGHSYVEMQHPADHAAGWQCRLDGEQAKLHCTVFQQSLEKGVILQSRFRAFLVPRQHDLETALDYYADFARSAPALTT